MGKPVTSCDNCRRSRLGCNVASEPKPPCFNCALRGLTCTTRPGVAGSRAQARPLSMKRPDTVPVPNSQYLPVEQPSAPMPGLLDDCTMVLMDSQSLTRPSSESSHATSSFSSCDSLAKSQQARTLHNLLWNVFATLLEPRIGLWIGGAGCPFITSSAASTPLISRLVIHLDKNQARAKGRSSDLRAQWITTASTDGDGPVVRRALVHAVYAYSVRWLHLANDDKDQDQETRHRFAARKQELSENLWAQARRHMYAVFSRPSYQSLLALYLFAIIPTAAHMQGDHLADQCLEASLSHQGSLTSIAQPSFFQQDSVMRLLNPGICPDVDMDLMGTDKPPISNSEEIKSMASVVYWFGIISDTTRALTRCRPSILLPGASGDAKVWDHVRQRAQEFQQRHSSLKIYRWRTPFSDDQVLTILQYAFAMKTSVWAAITRVQDAMVHQLSGISLADAVDAARKESNRFEEVFGQLLCMCQRDFLLLNRNTQMCYIGNLILADTLPSSFVFIDENLNPYDLRLCATRAIIIAVNLALQTSIVGTDGSKMMNVLVLDPYPDLLTNAIVRTGSSLFLLYNAQKLTTENVMTMFPVVISGLKVLADLSYTASEAIPLLQQKFAASGIDQAAFLKSDVLHQAAVSVAAPLDQEVFDAEVLRELEQQAATSTLKVNNSGEPDASPRSDQDLDPFDQFGLEFLSQDWTFDDCFAAFDMHLV